MAKAKDNDTVYLAKFDIKDGFWMLVCERGGGMELCVHSPTKRGQPGEAGDPNVAPKWIESPGYFCVASETARDVTSDYVETTIGTMTPHKFLHHTQTLESFKTLPKTAMTTQDLCYLLEVYG